MTSRFVVQDLGRMPYAAALEVQRERQREVIASRAATGPCENGAAGASVQYLLLVEHDPPVITISRRPGAAAHLLATASRLAEAGVQVEETDRGGDITYHGPGQLVVYPILDLNSLGLRLHGYMRFLEQIVIDVLASLGVRGERDACATGVWVPGHEPVDGSAPLVAAACTASTSAGGAAGSAPTIAPGSRKICAMGVRVSQWVSMHGLALNVTTDLSHFDLIVPCGLAGRGVTSLLRELGASAPGMGLVKTRLVDAFCESVRNAEMSAGSGASSR